MAKMNIYTLFNIDESGRVSKLDTHQIIHPLIKEVYLRDKGSKGDSEGKKKAYALRELTYVYHRADYKSPCNRRGISDADAHTQAVDLAGLEKTYKPDDVINLLIEDYREHSGGPYTKALHTLLATCTTIDKVAKVIDAKLKEALTVIENPASEEILNLAVDTALANSTKVIKLVSDLLPIRKKIDEAIEAALEEEENEQGYGGIEIEDSMRKDKYKLK